VRSKDLVTWQSSPLNQQGIEFLAEAAYDGGLASFLEAWFAK
jgi:hypothetical protein